MKLCFRKKRGLCLLLLIFCCGSTWSLNQRHGGSTRQTDRFCLRQEFHQLWESPMINGYCKYDDVDKKDTTEETERAVAASQQTSEMKASVVRGEDGADVAVSQSDEAVVTQLESTLTVAKDHEIHSGDAVRNNSEGNSTQSGDSPSLQQEEHVDQSLDSNRTLLQGDHKQNETENNTASILNDSIIQDKEAMPSFDEWKKIRLEQEKQEPLPPIVREPEHREAVVKAAERKRNRRNYASIECGAKLVSTNPNAEGASKVLVEAKDEYMLNPCNALQKGGMWFIVELCENIHPTHIELANFELYSSTGKEFVVYMSDHYQSREWREVGRYEMAHSKNVQSFPLDAPGFGKVIKVEFLSIYENNQYYCPLSLVRVFGTSMVDDYEEKVSEDAQPAQPEPLTNVVEPTPVSVTVGINENMVSRAKKAVYNIIDSVSKAVSGTKTVDGNCSDCSTNESREDTALFGQQFENCFELTNLSGLDGHLWPSMKCRFAEAAKVQRSCRPLLPAPVSIRIEPSPLKLLSNLSPPASKSASSTAVPSITMTAEMISPTRTAEAEKNEELRTQTKVPPMKLLTPTKNETPQTQPSATQSAEPEAVSVTVVKPNVKIPPLSHINPIPSVPSSPAPPVQATKENLFSRFENRIKKLELHMNLSGTYLEELSKRYRNQMEEMQAAFNKTVAALNMEAKKGLERDQNQQQALAVLQEKLTAVTESLRKLEIESDSLWWRLLLAYLGLLAVSIAIIIVISRLICQRVVRAPSGPEQIERQVLEILERERRVQNHFLQESIRSTEQVKLQNVEELDKRSLESVNMTEPLDLVIKTKLLEKESEAVKVDPECVEMTAVEVKIEPPEEPCSTEQQVEPFHGVSQKRKRRRKKHPREDFTEVSNRHLATTEVSQLSVKVVRSL